MKKTLLMALIIVCAAAHAETQDYTKQYSKCATTKDDRQRLACFDALTASMVKENSQPPAPKTAYQPMSLLDLKTDIKSLTGKKITSTGYVQMMGEMAFLKGELMDMTPVTISIEKLPRDDRKRAIQGCITTLCGATISGTVKTDGFTSRVDVDQIVWQ